MLEHLVKAREQGGAGPDGESASARRAKDDAKRNNGLEVNSLLSKRLVYMVVRNRSGLARAVSSFVVPFTLFGCVAPNSRIPSLTLPTKYISC